jgi:hypothetical protein
MSKNLNPRHPTNGQFTKQMRSAGVSPKAAANLKNAVPAMKRVPIPPAGVTSAAAPNPTPGAHESTHANAAPQLTHEEGIAFENNGGILPERLRGK